MLSDKIRRHRIEAFFFASVVSAALTAGYIYAQIAAALAVTAFFLSRRMFAAMSLFIISLTLFIHFTVLVTAEKDPGCEIRSRLDRQSGFNWTPFPELIGHSIRN